MTAIESKDVQKLGAALRDGANPNTRNREGITPLSAAAKLSSNDMIVLLLSYGADVNALDGGASALYWSILSNCRECAETLYRNNGKFLADNGQILYLKKFEYWVDYKSYIR